jgi:hypothetical protein
MADVSQQVALSLLTKSRTSPSSSPGGYNAAALDTLLDQVVAWRTARAAGRRFPGRRLNSPKPVPSVVDPPAVVRDIAGQVRRADEGDHR